MKNGEDVQGLHRALVLGGSESQVISLWPVSDVATKDLRQVQLRMIRGRKDRRHPVFWAAFIQSGEWKSLDGQGRH